MITIGDRAIFSSFDDAAYYAEMYNDEEDAGYCYKVQQQTSGEGWVIACWDDMGFIGFV